MKKRLIIYIIAIALVSTLLCSCSNTNDHNSNEYTSAEYNISVDITITEALYVVCYIGTSPQKLYYSEHKEIIDDIIAMVEGNYHYVSSYSNYGFEGGGPYSISIYNDNSELIYKVLYHNNHLCIPSGTDSEYYLYLKDSGELSFESFEEYCRSTIK